MQAKCIGGILAD